MRGLYVIVDVDSLAERNLDPIAFATAALAGSPALLQLRAKSSPPDVVVALMRALRPLCTQAHVPLVANDRPDLALIAGADMVHIGQTDASPTLARVVAPKIPLGISTHTPEQLIRALHAMPAYIAFGPVWSTRSKSAPDPLVGLSGLKQAAQLVRQHALASGFLPPLVAIGGITLERVHEVAPYVSLVAVIADLLPPRELEGAAAYDYVRTRVSQYGALFDDPTRVGRSPSFDADLLRGSGRDGLR